MGTARDKEDTHRHIFSRSKSPSTTESEPPVREVGYAEIGPKPARAKESRRGLSLGMPTACCCNKGKQRVIKVLAD